MPGHAADPTKQPEAYWLTNRAFVLDEIDEKTTRLITRARGEFRPILLIFPIAHLIVRPIHFIMQRKQLRKIKKGAKRLYVSQPSAG